MEVRALQASKEGFQTKLQTLHDDLAHVHAMLTCKQDDYSNANHKVHQLQDVCNDLKCDAKQLCTDITGLQAQLKQSQTS